MLHPAAEPIELRVEGDGSVRFEAKTSTVGPGYHQWLCEWVRSLGLDWQETELGDPSGYFRTGRREDLEGAFFAFVQQVAAQVLERAKAGMTGLQVSLPAGDVQYLAPGFVLTPLGPRDEAWWHHAVAEPSSGTDLFPWWSPGEGVQELSGRALSLMWANVVWRTPLTDGERATHTQVLRLLAEGAAAEPAFAWPWREWLELFLLNGGTWPTPGLVNRVRERALKVAPTVPLIGYLRHDVRVSVTGGWSVRVPGSFARAVEPDGVTLRLGDARRSVFLMTGGIDPNVKQALAPTGTGERLKWGHKKLDSAALVSPAGDGWQLVSNTIVPGAMAVMTVQFAEEEREWALRTWRSLAHPAARH